MDAGLHGQERDVSYTPTMAQKPKKRRRNRNDPRRQEIQKQREEARRRLAEQRRAEAETEAAKANRLAQLRRFGLPTVLGLAVFAVALVLFRPARELPGVQQPVLVDAAALEAGATFAYGTDTPTSGPYLPGDPLCGSFDEQISAEQAVTSLYHGGIVLWHRPDMAATDVSSLVAIANGLPEVTISPNAGIADPIVATAWGRQRPYDGPGDDVREFVDVYLHRGLGEGTCEAG